MGRNDKVYFGMLAVSVLLTVAAIITLIPSPDARWPNVLGYQSICPFAPAATATLALVAGCVCVARSRLFGPRHGMRRSWAVPIAVAMVVGIILPIPALLRRHAFACRTSRKVFNPLPS